MCKFINDCMLQFITCTHCISFLPEILKVVYFAQAMPSTTVVTICYPISSDISFFQLLSSYDCLSVFGSKLE